MVSAAKQPLLFVPYVEERNSRENFTKCISIAKEVSKNTSKIQSHQNQDASFLISNAAGFLYQLIKTYHANHDSVYRSFENRHDL